MKNTEKMHNKTIINTIAKTEPKHIKKLTSRLKKKTRKINKKYIRRTRPKLKQIALDSHTISKSVISTSDNASNNSKATSMVSEEYDFFNENEICSLNGMMSSYDLGCSNSQVSHSLFGESSLILDMSSGAADLFGKGKDFVCVGLIVQEDC